MSSGQSRVWRFGEDSGWGNGLGEAVELLQGESTGTPGLDLVVSVGLTAPSLCSFRVRALDPPGSPHPPSLITAGTLLSHQEDGPVTG